MRRMMVAIMLLGFALPAFASEVIPSRMVVEWLIKAVQEGKNEVVASCFKFDKEKHGKLSPLSRDEQVQLLKDIPLDKIAFEKDKYAVDDGKRFVVKLVAPKKLDFEVEYVELKGELGPPWKYYILAIRETAQPSVGATPPAEPSLATVRAAVAAAAIQKGIIVTSVERVQGHLSFLCKGELKTKPVPVSDTLVLKVSVDTRGWEGSIKFGLDGPIKVAVSEKE